MMVRRERDKGIRPEFAPPRRARHPDLRRLWRRSCRGAEADGVPLSGGRAFGGDLRGLVAALFAGARHLAGADAHQKKARDRHH